MSPSVGGWRSLVPMVARTCGDALRRGLTLQDNNLTNAYQFGFVGASDSHTGAASLDEKTIFPRLAYWIVRVAFAVQSR